MAAHRYEIGRWIFIEHNVLNNGTAYSCPPSSTTYSPRFLHANYLTKEGKSDRSLLISRGAREFLLLIFLTKARAYVSHTEKRKSNFFAFPSNEYDPHLNNSSCIINF
ncbi:hypothetical protein NPIL_493941 [Nephila pilipes]|uniref:Uncharacterized protein n=1 Tax=Nephila pilipes TaxID=299642 RepID=A0A8X6UCE3_NEPPI|nr:hypothetical protein NPIL_493941 [Nephila pilipes]